MKKLLFLPLLFLVSCSENIVRSGGFETSALTPDGSLPIVRATLSESERRQVNAWLKECCSFSARSLATYAPSHCCRVDGVSVTLTVSGSIIVINGPGGQYVKVRDAEDADILRLLRLP